MINVSWQVRKVDCVKSSPEPLRVFATAPLLYEIMTLLATSEPSPRWLTKHAVLASSFKVARISFTSSCRRGPQSIIQELCYWIVRSLKVVIEDTSYTSKTVLPSFKGAMLVVSQQLTQQCTPVTFVVPTSYS